jgi:acetyltransferase-like isoleucine patch superfamily enzyme
MLPAFVSRYWLRMIRALPLTGFYGLKRLLIRLAGVKAGRNVRVVSSVKIITPFVEIGENSFIGHECLLIAAHGSKIRIGKNVDFGPRCLIVTGTHEIGLAGHRAGAGLARDIVIGDGVWVGAGTTILAGVAIGAGSILAAGSIVAKDVEPNVLAGGNPAKVIRVLD